MKKWIKFGIPIAAVVVLVAWYAFRPERLVINRRVDEAMPSGQGDSSPQPLSTLLQHCAPDGRYRHDLLDGRRRSCSSPNGLQHIKRP